MSEAENTTPNYKVIELQAENENLKDQLITELRNRIHDLEIQVESYKELLAPRSTAFDDERDVSSHVVAPTKTFGGMRKHIRTMSEVALMLEQKSLNAKELPVSAEDLNDSKE